MLDLLESIHSSLRLIDLLDLIIVSFVVYRVLLLIKGTRAMQMLTGLGILGLSFFLSTTMELFTTHWVLSYFFDHLILIVIVLFQDDLRRALTHVGQNPFSATAAEEEEREMVVDIARAANRMANENIGALIVLERETGLKNFIDTGSYLDCHVRAELLYSIFLPDSPIHDGAVIIRGNRVSAAGCFLPLSKEPNIDKQYGSRHRAALGITEDTDAIVVLVSEEMGEVHLVKNGKITMNLNEQELRQSLNALLGISGRQVNLPKRLKGWVQAVRGKNENR